ncbi:ATP-binding protein [Fusicatenibacter sp.]
MIRKIVQIDEEKCTGCGLCAHACHESAIAMVDGKAKLIRDDYCDGFGDCLPVCPADAISFVEREALPYDEEAVKENQRKAKAESGKNAAEAAETNAAAPSQLRQWPVQIKLVQERASMFVGADLLVAADCTAYAYGNFHQDFIRNHVVLVGCTKLDDIDYSEKLARIFMRNDIKSITVARMEVPCCAGMERAVKMAVKESGKKIPVKTVVISTEGELLE